MIDEVLLGLECTPRTRGICSWTTALIVGGIAAAAGGLAHDIQGFVSGQTPWGNPGEWTKGALLAGGEGFAGGFVGGALGPALGAAGDALGIGSGTGTVAADAGAMTPQGLGGMVSKAATDVLGETGAHATGIAAKQALIGAAEGALKNTSNPGQGALMGAATGAAGSAAGSALQGLGNAGLNAQSPGSFFSPGPATDSYNYQPGVQMATPVTPPNATNFSYQPAGGMGGRFASNVALPAAANLGSQQASQAVGQAMTPPPQAPPENAYASFGIHPYWMRP